MELHREFMDALRVLGDFRVEVKKTSIHLVRESAFVGVHPRKLHLLVTVKSAGPISSGRIVKAEQVSKNRWHLELKITVSSDIDGELLGWIRTAYSLCG